MSDFLGSCGTTRVGEKRGVSNASFLFYNWFSPPKSLLRDYRDVILVYLNSVDQLVQIVPTHGVTGPDHSGPSLP